MESVQIQRVSPPNSDGLNGTLINTPFSWDIQGSVEIFDIKSLFLGPNCLQAGLAVVVVLLVLTVLAGVAHHKHKVKKRNVTWLED